MLHNYSPLGLHRPPLSSSVRNDPDCCSYSLSTTNNNWPMPFSAQPAPQLTTSDLDLSLCMSESLSQTSLLRRDPYLLLHLSDCTVLSTCAWTLAPTKIFASAYCPLHTTLDATCNVRSATSALLVLDFTIAALESSATSLFTKLYNHSKSRSLYTKGRSQLCFSSFIWSFLRASTHQETPRSFTSFVI